MRVPIFQALGVLVLVCSSAWAGSAHPNLVAWYRAENNALDSSGNGHHATMWSGAAAYTTGKLGRAFLFEGSEALNLGDSLLGVPMTFACWVYQEDGRHQVLLAQGDTLATILILYGKTDFGSADGQVRLVLGGGEVLVGPALLGKGWTHVALSIDASLHCLLYIDAEIYSENVAPAGIPADDTLLGARDQIQVYHHNGIIDDVRIYNAALTPSDIRRVMQGKQPLHRY